MNAAVDVDRRVGREPDFIAFVLRRTCPAASLAIFPRTPADRFGHAATTAANCGSAATASAMPKNVESAALLAALCPLHPCFPPDLLENFVPWSG
jgi:hypothetical protein